MSEEVMMTPAEEQLTAEVQRLKTALGELSTVLVDLASQINKVIKQ